jgi:hypothetical protein
VAATRAGNAVRIFVDGQQVAEKIDMESTPIELTNQEALQIGFGPNDHFKGRLSDVRFYRRALTAHEVAAMAKEFAIETAR